MKEPVDIIVLNMNGLNYLKMLIPSLYKNTEYPFNLIVVDNVSTDGSREYLKRLKEEKENVILHFNREPDRGFADGNNRGLKYCSHEYVVLMNNDIIVPKQKPCWLSKLVDCIEQDPKIAIVAPKLLYPNDTIQFAGTFLRREFIEGQRGPDVWGHVGRFQPKYRFSERREMGGLTFACVLARRKILGKLDEEYEIGMYEDNAKCAELREKGYKLWYCGDAFLYHYETATQFRRDPGQLERQRMINAARFHQMWGEKVLKDYQKNPEIWSIRNDPVRISAIILTYNNKHTIEKALSSLKYFDEKIVYDSGSTDGTKEYLRTQDVRLIEGPEIDDFSKTRNKLVWEAKYPYVFFLDSDEIINQNVYYELKKFFEQSPDFLVRFARINIARDNLFYVDKFPDYQTRAGEKQYLRYSGKIHEHIKYTKILTSSFPIVHYGNCLEQWNRKKWKYITRKNHILGHYAPFEKKHWSEGKNFQAILRYYKNLQVRPVKGFRNLPEELL